MFETINRSNFKILKIKDMVNLERAMTLNTRLGGHLVTGDVECEGVIKNIKNIGIAKIYMIELSSKYSKYVVEKGRITIDGASLTVVDISKNQFSVSLIPFTANFITLGNKKSGDVVNIETDIIGKYIENFMGINKKDNEKKDMTLEFLLKNNF
jgi:riboflavin synthase